MKSFEIDDAISMFEQAIEQQDTDFPNECRKFVGWLRELKEWRSQPPMCMTCKHFKKSADDEPCIACREWSNWELNIKE